MDVNEATPTLGSLIGKEKPEPVPEQDIWIYVTHILLALKTIHDNKLAARVLADPSRILLGPSRPSRPGNRIYLNCLGMLDALRHDSSKDNDYWQQQDLQDLGRLILQLSTGRSLDTPFHVEEVMGGANMSRDLKCLVAKLLPPSWSSEAFKTVSAALAAVSGRAVEQLHTQLSFSDSLEAQLKEQQGKFPSLPEVAFRLMSICERPHLNRDQNWAETGDRYLCKLFRDHLFFRCTVDGAPDLDRDYITKCLSKLDSRSSEKITLTSSDRNVVLTVSYNDVARCMDASFSELEDAVQGHL